MILLNKLGCYSINQHAIYTNECFDDTLNSKVFVGKAMINSIITMLQVPNKQLDTRM